MTFKYTTVLLTIFTKLYITSRDLPDNWTFVPFGHLHPFRISLFTIHPHHLWQPAICSLYHWVMFVHVCLFFLIPRGIEIIWYLSLSVWLISLSIMPSSSKSIHGFLNFCYMIISICSYFSFYTYIALFLTFGIHACMIWIRIYLSFCFKFSQHDLTKSVSFPYWCEMHSKF